MTKVIPFYGGTDRQTFAIERTAMDREGKVVARLDAVLPRTGTCLDIGAGDGFSAASLTTRTRSITCVEPAHGMIDQSQSLHWVQGVAQDLPFADNTFDGVYATWAYFFPRFHDISEGLAEARRVAKPGSPLVIVDNAGEDEFSRLAGRDLGTDMSWWRSVGFDVEVIETAFVFESMSDARHLLTMYFGDEVVPARTVQFRVAMMTATA